jgi:subtilisin family serine protease
VSSIVAGYDPVRNYTGVAPDAQLVVYSVFVNADNNTSEETALIQTVANIAWALRDCIKEQVDVVNMSFYADDDGSDPKYSDLTAALKEAYEAGIMLVNSMGNSGSYSSTYPACLPYVTAVGAVDYNTIKDRFELASFSSKGWDVSYVGIGEDVIAEQSRGVYVASSGTSFSSPIICGMFALMIQQQRSQLGGRNKKIPIPTLLKLMNETTIDLFSKGKDRKSGYGIPIFGK